MNPALGERLRAETRDLHRAAERAGIMPALLRGTLDRARYGALLCNLHALYEALEAALTRHAARAELSPVVFPALFRRQALADDLRSLHGAGWPSAATLQPATQRYVARLHELDAAQPALLAAHAYVRYLGDLSGGQMLRKIVARAYALASDAGVRFYDFGDAASVAAHLQRFRAGLAALPPDVAASDALVAESRWAFGMHCNLFDELAVQPV